MSKTTNTDGKPLRFAALIRVSTEKQAKQGESLRTQATQIDEAVATMQGDITMRYGGQEHATAGWERKELAKLLKDASKTPPPFDAVIVTDASRWSRDPKSEQQLELLKDCGIRFFTLTHEHDLHSDDARLFLSLSTVINGYQARVSSRKSLVNRIERAKRGVPTAGSLPYGRTFNPDTGKWGVVPAAQALMQTIARRYLAGERIHDLAVEYGLNEVALYCRLNRAGDKFEMHFNSDKMGIHEPPITITVPPLLDAKTMAAIRRQMEANRTYHRKHLKHRYVLSRMVFCGYCGSAMSGQFKNGCRYYRHLHSKPCKLRGYVPADAIEDLVVRSLYEGIGNPIALQRAVDKATPNRSTLADTRRRYAELGDELVKLSEGRDRILMRLARHTITDAQADKVLLNLKNREEHLQTQRAGLEALLENVPTTAAVGEASKGLSRWMAHHDLVGLLQPEAFDDRRQLVERVFGGKSPEGKRLGVYVRRGADGAWEHRIIGQLVGYGGGVTDFSPYPPR